ncbi:MAG: MBL fold metallo-hydrolase [Thermoguttaceae bacterium]|nr:MBL fold metallo-hydrolase [Thermoguttaceae bacterium]
MDRRAFLSLGLAAPFALKAGAAKAEIGVDYTAEDPSITASYAKDPNNPEMVLWQLPDVGTPQKMAYVMRTREGKTVVFDGGFEKDIPYLIDLIKTECGGRVDAWFLTHAHGDHCMAISEYAKNHQGELDIETLYYNFPSQEWLDETEKGSVKETAGILEGLALYKGATRAPEVNEVFDFGSLKIKCLNDYDEKLTMNSINNSSICFRLDVAEKSILILGDLGVEGGDRLVEMQGPEVLKCDFCQMAHHGQNGVRKEFYEIVKPSVCLWPTPRWLWHVDSGKGYGSGPWATLKTRAWMDELEAETHFVMKDGLIKILF